MIWERCSWYRGRKCIVCHKSTSGMVAPLGIVSGSFPCCMGHDEREVREAYFEVLQEHLEAIGGWVPNL